MQTIYILFLLLGVVGHPLAVNGAQLEHKNSLESNTPNQEIHDGGTCSRTENKLLEECSRNSNEASKLQAISLWATLLIEESKRKHVLNSTSLQNPGAERFRLISSCTLQTRPLLLNSVRCSHGSRTIRMPQRIWLRQMLLFGSRKATR
jgi:hypothetical protein